MTVSEWMDVPGNQEWYNKHIKSNKRMQDFLSAVQAELSFETRPPEMISGEMALTLHGRNVGAQRVLKMIQNAGAATVATEQVIAGYGVEKGLIEMGYSEEAAKKLSHKYMEDM